MKDNIKIQQINVVRHKFVFLEIQLMKIKNIK